jgi:acetyltransferase-like isoleucine patch superfamily enzyme
MNQPDLTRSVGSPINFIDISAVVHPTATVWHFATILQKCVLEKDVMVGSGTELGRGTTVGEGSRIGAHVFFPSNSKIGKYVFVGPGTVCTDDKYPKVTRPWDKPYNAQPPVIGDGAAIGAGVILMPGVKIGIGARIAAGSIVTRDVPNYCAVRGGPARFFQPPEEWNPLSQLGEPIHGAMAPDGGNAVTRDFTL